MTLIDTRYNQHCSDRSSDIWELLPIIRDYASKGQTCTEMGVRKIVSSWAILASRPKKLLSVDIFHPSHYGANLDEVYIVCQEEHIDFEFWEKSDLEIEIPQTDFLFVDTDHTNKQLSQELSLHCNHVSKYILMHDVEHCKEEMIPAIYQFLYFHPEWAWDALYHNNNGLGILKRVA